MITSYSIRGTRVVFVQLINVKHSWTLLGFLPAHGSVLNTQNAAEGTSDRKWERTKK